MAVYGTFGDPRRRRRRQALWRSVRFLFALIAVFGVGLYGYLVGVSAGEARSEQLEADLVRFQRANLDLRDQATLAGRRSQEAEAALDDMRRRYAANIPTGDEADLLEQVRAQLGAGVALERLAFLIEAAGVEACRSAPVTKRFMPRTPISTGPRSFIRFDDRITVTGEGSQQHTDAAGKARASPRVTSLACPKHGTIPQSRSASSSGCWTVRRRASRGWFRSLTRWWSTARNTALAPLRAAIADSSR